MNPYLYTLSGLAVGAIVGLTGVGGGSLMTPLLVLAFGVHPVSAVGTDLIYASVTKGAGSLVHGRNQTIHWRATGLLMIGSVPAAIASAVVVHVLNMAPAQAGSLVARTLGVCLMLTALTVIYRNKIIAFARTGVTETPPATQAALTVATGVALGVLVTFTSVGAGALGVTALILLYPRANLVSIVGADILHAVPLTLIAGLGHAASGSVDFGMLVYLLAGSVPGVVAGALLAPKIHERSLRLALACVLMIVGARLAFG